MKSFGAIAAFVAVANAYAYNTTSVEAPPVYETTTVNEYTTVCEGPTTIPVNPTSTITVSESTTLTITDCPCTITYPVKPTHAPEEPQEPEHPIHTEPAVPAPPKPVYPSGNATAPVYPTGTAAPTTPEQPVTPTEFPGAAGKAGLSLLAVGGALAAFL